MISTEREFFDTVTLLTDFKDPLDVVVAFSGGCDSLALLILCAKTLGKEHVYPLYVNHRLRTDSELEAEMNLNRKNCEKLGLSLTVADLEKDSVLSLASVRKGGVEDAARSLRYSELEAFRIKTGCSFILTAHHRQDQVETVLMKIMRKAPLPSLRGISEKSGVIIRPLLSMTRAELEAFVRSEGFTWSEDSTNVLEDYDRNKVRHSVIPALSKVMADYEQRILAIRDKALSMCLKELPEGSVSANTISLESLEQMNEMQKILEIYRCWDSVFGYKSMPQTLLDRIQRAVSEKKSARISANGAHVSITDSQIIITDASEDVLFENYHAPLAPSQRLTLPASMWCELSDEGSSTDIRLPGNLEYTIRFVRIGDSIALKEGRKTVLKLLQDMKIPSALRFRVPIICDSEGVCAVAGELYGGRNRVALRHIGACDTVYVKFGL